MGASSVYVTHGITPMSAWVVCGIVAALGVWIAARERWVKAAAGTRVPWRWNTYAAVTILCDAWIAWMLWNGRTDAALQSPWHVVPPWFFFVYACATAALIGAALTNARARVALFTHTGVSVCVALIAFRFGFGYDPLVHQTAEQFVVSHGKILPLQPFYVGQYALVALAHFVTHAPVWFIDRALVPLAASVTLPWFIYRSCTDGFKLSPRASVLASVAVLIVPLAELTFTVPYNVSVLYALWWVTLIPCAHARDQFAHAALGMLTLAAACTHPLLGVPLFIAQILFFSVQKFDARETRNAACTTRHTIAPTIGGIILVCGAIVGMFGVYRLRAGVPFFSSVHPLYEYKNFFSVIAFPYSRARLSWWMRIALVSNFVVPYVILAGGVWILIRTKKYTRAARVALGALVGGSACALFFMSTMLAVPGVLPHEQHEFALRLRYVLPILMLPWVATYSGAWFAQKYEHARTKKYAVAGTFILVACITNAFFFSYPVVSAATRPGWNVSADDFATVHIIERDAARMPYVVIANQVLSAAALHELGFEQRVVAPDGTRGYPYAIGPAEPLYPLTQKILYGALDADDVRDLRDALHGAVYVAVDSYWFRADAIAREALAAHPQKIFTVGSVVVYEF